MLKIAICSKQQEIRTRIELILKEYASEIRVVCMFDIFKSLPELEMKLRRGSQFDLLFLELQKAETENQIWNGRYLRDTLFGYRIQIVLLSEQDMSAEEICWIIPFDFLVAPYRTEQIYQVLSRLIDMKKQNHFVYPFKAERQIYYMDFRDILYVTVGGRKVKLHTVNGEFEFYSSMKALMDGFPAEYFIQIHKSYLVNVVFLKIVENEKIILRDGISIPISRNYRKKALGKIQLYNEQLLNGVVRET